MHFFGGAMYRIFNKFLFKKMWLGVDLQANHIRIVELCYQNKALTINRLITHPMLNQQLAAEDKRILWESVMSNMQDCINAYQLKFYPAALAIKAEHIHFYRLTVPKSLPTKHIVMEIQDYLHCETNFVSDYAFDYCLQAIKFEEQEVLIAVTPKNRIVNLLSLKHTGLNIALITSDQMALSQLEIPLAREPVIPTEFKQALGLALSMYNLLQV